MKKYYQAIKQEVNKAPIIYALLAFTLTACFFLRVYRIDELLMFHYDQGRDAITVWNLWHEGKFFLTGPVTGLAGIFLGPAYYYIIAPFYLIGGGSPLYPAVFLALIVTAGISLTF